MYPAVLLMYFIYAAVILLASLALIAQVLLPYNEDVPGPVTHSGEILTTGKSHGKKPDRFSLNDNMDVEKVHLPKKALSPAFVFHQNTRRRLPDRCDLHFTSFYISSSLATKASSNVYC